MPWIWLKMIGISEINFHSAEFIKCIFMRFSFTETWFLAQQGKGNAIFYFSLPLPPAHKHWDFYLQHCIWVEYLVFLIAVPVITKLSLDNDYRVLLVAAHLITKLLLDEIYLTLGINILLNFNCILKYWFNARSCCSNFLQTSGVFELVSTTTLE